MKFSVVIPLYNKAGFVRGAIDSVLAQTVQDFEIIVVDDGSTDGSADVVAALSDPRLRLLSQPNAGVSATRNRAIAMAQGEWVAFLDADDWYHPDYLTSLVLAQGMHPTADMVATQYVCVSESIEVWPSAWQVAVTPLAVELIDNLPDRWMKGPTFFTSSACIRTTCLRQLQPCFPVGESHGEDLDLWFRVAEISSIALVHRPLVAYRIAIEGSLSLANPLFVLPPFLDRMRTRALSGAMTSRQRRSALQLVAHQEITLAREALVSGQRMKAVSLICQARHAASSRRWWFTAAMAVFIPGELIRRWQDWRIHRAIPTLGAG